MGSNVNGSNNSTNISVANDTSTEVNSLTVSKGTWLLVASAEWVANATGYRQIAFASTKDPAREQATTAMGISGKDTFQQVVLIRTVESDTTYKLYARQNSGSALTIYPHIYARKIGM